MIIPISHVSSDDLESSFQAGTGANGLLLLFVFK
jgi:hypothetical protein